MPSPPVGFIGLGQIGAPMARRLQGGGGEFTVYDLRPEAMAPFQAAGARSAGSPAEVGERSEVVFTCLPGPAEVVEVALGPGGLVEGLQPGSVHIDLSTSDPAADLALDAAYGPRGVGALDCAVTGGVPAAEEGSLTLLAGGEVELLARCRPLLERIGAPERIFHLGGRGLGHAAKLVNNMFSHVAIAAACELMTLAVKAGGDAAVLYDVLSEGSGWSRVFRHKMAFGIRRDFASSMRCDLCWKDLEVCLEMAKRLGLPLVLAPAAQQLFQAARARGWGGENALSVLKVCEEFAGVEVRGR